MSRIPDSYQDAYKFNQSINEGLLTACRPFFEKMGLNYMSVTTYYPDGTQFNAMTNLNFFLYGLEQDILSAKSKNFCNNVKKIPNRGNRFWIWTGEPREQMYESFFEHDIWNGISFGFRERNYLQFYGFGTGRDNQAALNDYINNTSVFHQFIHSFKGYQAELTSLSKKKGFLHSGYTLPDYEMRDHKIPKQQFHLTPRECDVLNLLGQGMQLKEIAFNLGISYRTAECYMQNAKERHGCKTTLELFKQYMDSTRPKKVHL